MFSAEFANAEMICIPENIFQRGYWNKLSFYKLRNISPVG